GKPATGDPGTPKVQASDRDVLNLMTKRAQTLHLGNSFTDRPDDRTGRPPSPRFGPSRTG
ncbi:MAG: hypothetical protein ACRDOE_11750, partial [Streptosporangiaceae bacterium]